MEINNYLYELGLSDKEIKVYLAILELGENPIMPIKKKVGLPRTTAFHALEQLKSFGLIEILETPKRRVYVPYPPRKIVSVFNHKANKLREQAESIQKDMSELNQLFGSATFMPKVRFFVGDEIREIYEEILDSPIDELIFVGETNKIEGILGHNFFRDWVKRKVQKGIWTRSIRVKNEENLFFDPNDSLRKARFAPESFKAPAQIYIYHNSVAIISSANENFATVITSREYAGTMKHWFSELWKVSKPANN
ncbi:MAG: helix-turn-helix domain-containing protein [bacterium]